MFKEEEDERNLEKRCKSPVMKLFPNSNFWGVSLIFCLQWGKGDPTFSNFYCYLFKKKLVLGLGEGGTIP